MQSQFLATCRTNFGEEFGYKQQVAEAKKELDSQLTQKSRVGSMKSLISHKKMPFPIEKQRSTPISPAIILGRSSAML